jgi:hypothetical protein
MDHVFAIFNSYGVIVIMMILPTRFQLGLLICITLFLIGFSGCGSSQNEHKKKNDDSKIYGIVSDDLKVAISGAEISIYESEENTISSEDGSYEISIPAGEYTIIATAEGYSTVEISDIKVIEGEAAQQNISLTYTNANMPPEQPILYYPADEEGEIDLKPQLKTEMFIDNDPHAIHKKSHWQVAIDPRFGEEDILVDLNSNEALTDLSLSLILAPQTTYYWRVRFFDNRNTPSVWSKIYSFSTVLDSDQDGMPDAWEQLNGLNPDVYDAEDDPDSDGLNNLEEYCLNEDPLNPHATGNGSMLGFIRGIITDIDNNAPIEAQIITNEACLTKSRYEDGTFFMAHPIGRFSVSVSADEYYRVIKNDVEVSEVATNRVDIQMEPFHVYEPDGSDNVNNGGSRSSGGGCFLACLMDE